MIPAGDWNTVQQPAAQRWEEQHAADKHGGGDFSDMLEPSPFNE